MNINKNKKVIIISIMVIISIAGIIGLGISKNKSGSEEDNILASSDNDNSNESDSVDKEDGSENTGDSTEGKTEGTDTSQPDQVISNGDGESQESKKESDNPEDQPPPSKPNGASMSEFEKKLKEIGYSHFEDKCYDYFEDNTSIVFVEIQESGVKFTLKDKDKISHDAIKGAIAELLPNESQELFKIISDGTSELAISLDNRTASIEKEGAELMLHISN